MNGGTSKYDLAEAKKRLELISPHALEYKEAQSLLAQIKTREKAVEVGSYASPVNQNPQSIPLSNTPPQRQANTSQPAQAILHVEDNKKIPVAVTQDDFYAAQDALYMNDEYEKALALVHRGKIFMIENNSPIIVIEPFGYLTKIKVKKTGREGWVKSSWIQ